MFARLMRSYFNGVVQSSDVRILSTSMEGIHTLHNRSGFKTACTLTNSYTSYCLTAYVYIYRIYYTIHVCILFNVYVLYRLYVCTFITLMKHNTQCLHHKLMYLKILQFGQTSTLLCLLHCASLLYRMWTHMTIRNTLQCLHMRIFVTKHFTYTLA